MYGYGNWTLPGSWHAALADEMAKPYFKDLVDFVGYERENNTVYPAEGDVFRAFELTPFEQVKVVLLGQDPYHDEGQAHGLCFSVLPGVKPPASLANIFKELAADLGCGVPSHGNLQSWAEQGVLLLNTVLTVRAHTPGSHKNKGWEKFTDAVIRALSNRGEPLVFALWGDFARKKAGLIDERRHRVLVAPHPSPILGKGPKFLGSRPFSAINAALEDLGYPAIDWQIF
ncbi:Uracil-DNA glycosylase [Nannocystis exedens]|uniref:Uracil-DNA glycosylase n=1 Tax=Nannocystis exedens TaxID=54 RepID=A0A1I2ED89_9BACT|nr:uracil-DNA glycosylase [Nannocystis exedens]PCC74790.1 uracil-DNA glycosylase [Nannocystis exedens]SFE90815.1 Uracil-DNA glycosylase [Nannocystis exedens]